MFSSRKGPLSIALTAVCLLAMLAPAAVAAPNAPNFLEGISIQAPTNADPALIEGDDGDEIIVDFTITTSGTQVCDVGVTFQLIDQNGDVELEQYREVEAADLQEAANVFAGDPTPEDPTVEAGNGEEIVLHHWPDSDQGWYDLLVTAQEQGDPAYCEGDKKFQALEAEAVLIDGEEPEVELVKPGDDEYRGATFVTGKEFLLVGEAWDRFGVASAEFQYCIEGRECKWGDDWYKIADAVQSTVDPEIWQAVWDSTAVPDTGEADHGRRDHEKQFAMIRICAYDLVGNTNCEEKEHHGPDRTLATISADGITHFNPWPDMHWVFVNNRFEMDLFPGWNLISTPLMPYDTAIANVLGGLKTDDGQWLVAEVWTRVFANGAWGWQKWAPPCPGCPASTLSTIVDGQGYWIRMLRDAELTIVGTWNNAPNPPPTYPVYDGWNLIGYTQYGVPTFFHPKNVETYLGPFVFPNTQTLWCFDPQANIFEYLEAGDDMNLGGGCWLGVGANGNIKP